MPHKLKTRPRVGVPWRTARQGAGSRQAYVAYLDAVRRAGGAPVEIPLSWPAGKLRQIAETLDAFVLPGSGADVDPKRYRAKPHRATKPADPKRENIDFELLRHALPAAKPVLAICYGLQSLNVHLGGSLFQDIAAKPSRKIAHKPKSTHGNDVHHVVKIEGGHLAKLADRSKVRVNSWHHQCVNRPGHGLRVTARAPDGVIEAVEATRGPGWVVGVQWHPERMPHDSLAKKLFERLVSEAARAAARR